MSKYVLAIDVGTQSMRGCIFDEKGNLLIKEQIKYPPYIAKSAGYVEQSADFYWDVMCKITNGLNEKEPEKMQQILAMSVDTFRDTAVLLDENNKPLRDCIIWSDQRSSDISEPLPFKQRFLLSLVGMTRPVNAIRKKVKTRWVQQNEPELWKKVKKVPHLSGYLNYKLTGNLLDTYASSIGHLPFDCEQKRWLNKKDMLYPIYDMTPDYMTDLVHPGEELGKISAEAAKASGLKEGLTVIASGSDKGCETLGLGCLAENVAAISFGTSATVQFSTQKHINPEPMMPSYPSVLKGYYNPEVQIFRGFWTISWFVKNFAQDYVEKAKQKGVVVEELLNEEMKKVPAGCDGLILQPFWQGGLTTPEARGAIIGFTDGHSREHMYRAIIEGIDFALREGLERMEKRGKMHIDYCAVSGGGSQNDLICQICANILNKPVRRTHVFENTALGAAIATFTAIGVYSSAQEAVDNMVRYEKEFLPQAKEVAIYNDLYTTVYLKLYKKLQRFYIHLEEKRRDNEQ